jgi:hypothetical protein
MRRIEGLPRERLAQRVSAAAYGSVLVLAALAAVGIGEIDVGSGAELVAGVGLATWLAHLFAELVAGHVEDPEPLDRAHVRQAALDGSPILAATILPALVLFLGRLDMLPDRLARVLAIAVAVLQLLAVGALVGHVTPVKSKTKWIFAVATLGIGVVVVGLTIALGH